MWFVVILICMLLEALLTPKQKFNTPRASSLGDFQVPTAEAGRPVPVLFGTCKVGGANVVWTGAFKVVPITKKMKTGMFSSSKVTTGYRYYMGMMLTLCHGTVDEIYEIQFDNRKTKQTAINHTNYTTLDTDDFNLFGGDEKEGGVKGLIDVYVGNDTQTGDSYLSANMGGPASYSNSGGWVSSGPASVQVPGFRGICYAVLKDFYLGTSNYIKSPQFIVGRWPNGLGLTSNHHKIPSADQLSVGQYGSGTGTCTSISQGGSPITEAYDVVATDPTHFSVTGRVSGALGTATVGTPFVSAQIHFTINSGSVAFVAGDKFIIGVDAGYFDANPACVAYEIITNSHWGCRIDSSLIDTASFIAVGNTLYSENTGISFQIDQQRDGWDLLHDIIQHVDVAIFADPTTGLITMKLIRPDYVIADAPVMDESIIKTLEMTRGSWELTTNTIKATYVDRALGFADQTVQTQDLANIEARGGDVVVESIQLPMCSNADAATAMCGRHLTAMSYPLARFHTTINRNAWALKPGSPFVLNWPYLGISGMACRVVKIQYGTLESGEITLDAVEDVWNLEGTAYSAPTSTDWSDPAPAISPLPYQVLSEVPYQLQYGSDALNIITIGARASASALGYQVWDDLAGGTSYAQSDISVTFSPSVSLVSDMAQTDTLSSLIVTKGPDADHLTTCTASEYAAGVNVLVFGQEIIAFQNVVDNGDGTLTLSPILRGVMDTTPQNHSSGAIGYSYQGHGLVQEGIFPADLTLTAKLLPYNGREVLPITDATQISITTHSRAKCPYPPGNLKFNSAVFPAAFMGDLAITWQKRERHNQPDLVSQADNTAYSAGAAQPIPVTTIDEEDHTTLLTTNVGLLTDTSYTLTAAAELIITGLSRLQNSYRVKVGCRDVINSVTYDSLYPQDVIIDRADYGYGYGVYYGGY